MQELFWPGRACFLVSNNLPSSCDRTSHPTSPTIPCPVSTFGTYCWTSHSSKSTPSNNSRNQPLPNSPRPTSFPTLSSFKTFTSPSQHTPNDGCVTLILHTPSVNPVISRRHLPGSQPRPVDLNVVNHLAPVQPSHRRAHLHLQTVAQRSRGADGKPTQVISVPVMPYHAIILSHLAHTSSQKRIQTSPRSPVKQQIGTQPK